MTLITQQANKPRLECTKCGASCEAACGCGVEYRPAIKRAADAIAAAPEKSDRTIAAEIGVGRTTVARARAEAPAGGPHGPPEATAPAGGPHGPPEPTAPAGGPHGPPEKRLGKDGKRYSKPARRKREPKVTAAPKDDFLARVNEAIRLATYHADCATREDIEAARKASAAWHDLAALMEKQASWSTAPSTPDEPDQTTVAPNEGTPDEPAQTTVVPNEGTPDEPAQTTVVPNEGTPDEPAQTTVVPNEAGGKAATVETYADVNDVEALLGDLELSDTSANDAVLDAAEEEAIEAVAVLDEAYAKQ